MMQNLGCVLLIDDNEADNFFHQLVIEGTGFHGKLVVHEHATEALSYLQNLQQTEYVRPDIIFLDINMPGMNGWDFLHAYEQLPAEQKGRIVVVLLSTTLTQADREKVAHLPSIDAFCQKPLQEADLKELVEKYC
ncbi:MAG: response regulator [Bacteroidota bacterium]